MEIIKYLKAKELMNEINVLETLVEKTNDYGIEISVKYFSDYYTVKKGFDHGKWVQDMKTIIITGAERRIAEAKKEFGAL